MREDIRRDRLSKLKHILESKRNPFPARTARTHTIAEARARFTALSRSKKIVSLVGRVMGIRDQGGVVFLDLKDESGRIQIVAKKETSKHFTFWQSVWDRGDFLSVRGALMKTKRGEESVDATEITILSKSVLPLPSEWYGVEETELKLRKRYLDFLLNPDVQELFRKKAVYWNTFRNRLVAEGFLEVELPILEHVPGGAEAEPFKTHMNALDSDFYLRISLELPLKKLLVAGYEKVFEIGRIFRNEGMDREHLQDYTQLEFYWAYHDYRDMMKLTESMLKEVVKKVTGGYKTVHSGVDIDWGKKWPVMSYVELFMDANNINTLETSKASLEKRARELNLKPEPHSGVGRLIDLIYKKTVRPHLVQPCFLIDPPVEIEPLAKRLEANPGQVERFQIMAGGTELAKGFSELNDPIDQRTRFEEQMKLRAAGDREAQMLDEDFLEALEYGMPPAAGFGISERFFSVIMDKSIRETVIFPLLREKTDE